MSFYLTILIAVLTCGASVSSAQSNPTMRSGRPGQAISPFAVGLGYFQIESGIDQAWQESAASNQNTGLTNHVLRFGLTELFELNGVVAYRQDRFSDPQVPDKNGVSDFQLGFVYNVNEAPSGWVPAVGIQTRFKMTDVGSDYRSDQEAPVIIVATTHNLTDSVSLSHNLGVDYDGQTPVPKYTAVSNLSFPVFEKWSGFVEVFGNVQDSIGDVLFDAGFAYAVNDDLQLDGSGGWGNNRGTSESFVSVGVSWRAQVRK